MTNPPEDFPCFVVPGQEGPMQALRELFWLHYQPAGPLIPLWDEWMPMATLWPARGTGAELGAMRRRWVTALTGRGINTEGYVHTQQHDGPAHAEGWPFPLWTQAGGVGWHFQGTGVPGYDAPRATPEGWTVSRAKGGEVNDRGWVLELTEPRASAQSPAIGVSARTCPWLRLNWWAEGLEQASCYVEWTTQEQAELSPDRRFYFAPATAEGGTHTYMPMGGGAGRMDLTRAETRTMIPVYRVPGWTGTITGLRLCFDNAGPAKVVIKSFHTACDTRHPINNPNFIRGVHDYFVWSRDLTFLRDQIGRVRTAMRFTMREFDTRDRRCIYTTWPGHEGRSGVRWTDAGEKQIIPGEGIGGNYWDLLPFGGEDALATIYYHDALLDLATLEETVAAHPEWGVAKGANAFDPADLRRHAREVREYGAKRFWNPETDRFGTVDLDGVMHDYGWTFLNNEAVYHGFATAGQTRRIRDWISGRRLVEGDSSTGADIYHWRFGPRATTRRNLDYYFWGWSSPESIPWGYQVQDGGAVLGFSYHDLICRLAVDGPDDAWQRLKEILVWFAETQAEGGYRAYYEKDPTRGTMQGGNVAGGLGLDKEFFESILVPQVMLYGFLGFEPTPEGFRLRPRLPRDWPALTITRIHLHEVVIDLTAKADGTVQVLADRASDLPLVIELSAGEWRTGAAGAQVHGNRITLPLAPGMIEISPRG
ncbi:MAG: hypothetical protein WDA75_11135 [Candidatus Latescibacterota bacterium]|jgi:hypothetical protein